MIVCDLTHAYHETSGGIRTYVDAKRQYVLEHTGHTHVLIVPGEADAVEHGDRWVTYRVKSPVIPFAAPYRFFVRPRRILDALTDARPDVVELNSLYLEPGQAFRYRKANPRAVVSGYYFTDLPHAYVGAPVSGLLGDAVGGWAERRAEAYVQSIFQRCDLRLAPSPAQAERLATIGVADVEVAVPGVDLDTFHPGAATPEIVRAAYNVPADALLVSYAGRLDAEKRTDTMVEAVRLVNRTRPAVLLMAGAGPHRERLEAEQATGAPVRVLPYLSTPDLARVLASSDLYLTAGPHETFALSVLEAQAAGLPVVGVAAGALTERVLPGLGILGPVDDTPAMAANVLAVVDEREAMGRAARRHVEDHFSWEATFRHLFGLYDRALADSA